MTLPPPSSEASASSSYAFIDVLRALAASLVIVYHVIEVGPFHQFPRTSPLDAFHVGFIGVDLFLVISGFVISLSALREYDRDPDGYMRRFFVRRIARIVPLYLFTCAVFILLVDASRLGSAPLSLLRHVTTHVLFIHNLFPGTHGSINGVTWSLALEMQFYVAVALATPLLARARPFATLLVLVAFAIGYRFVVLSLDITGEDYAHRRFIFTTQLPGTLDAFGSGIALALVPRNGPSWLKRRLLPSPANFCLFATLTVVAYTLTLRAFWAHAGNYWDHLPSAAIWRTALALTFGLAVASAITMPTRVAEARIFAPLRALGDISYGLYLWHMMVIVTIAPVTGINGWRLLVTTFVGAALLGTLSWHMLEKPMLARVTAWFHART